VQNDDNGQNMIVTSRRRRPFLLAYAERRVENNRTKTICFKRRYRFPVAESTKKVLLQRQHAETCISHRHTVCPKQNYPGRYTGYKNPATNAFKLCLCRHARQSLSTK